MKVAEKLMDLAPYVEVVNLNEGETLGDQGCGLYFIEHGIIVSMTYSVCNSFTWKQFSCMFFFYFMT